MMSIALCTASAPTRSKRVTGVHIKMVSLILATVLCMGLQHAYYHYLNGRAPSARLDSSGFLRDQTAVSDIGSSWHVSNLISLQRWNRIMLPKVMTHKQTGIQVFDNFPPLLHPRPVANL